MEAMEDTLADVWRPVKGMHMRVLGKNLFAFYFFHPVDMQRVLAVGPRHFVNHVMVLKEVPIGKHVTRDKLYEVPFWIQIHGLPPDRLTIETSKQIGAGLGRCVEVDDGGSDSWGGVLIRASMESSRGMLSLERRKAITDHTDNLGSKAIEMERKYAPNDGNIIKEGRRKEIAVAFEIGDVNIGGATVSEIPTKHDELNGPAFLQTHLLAEPKRDARDRKLKATTSQSITPVAMSILYWNCWRLGNPRAVRCLIELVRLKTPLVVFLSETLLEKRRMECIRRRLGYRNCFTVDQKGREVQMVGGLFTWRQGRIYDKLDRGLATLRWMNLFPQAQIHLLPPLASDHTPLWVTLDGRRDRQSKHKRRLRFKEMWLQDNGCQEKVCVCSKGLHCWSESKFGHVQKRLKQCVDRLDMLRRGQNPQATYHEEQCLIQDMEEWLAREEIMWRQQSREIWLQEGDRNTHFFHKRASRRQDRNKVDHLQDETREWKSKPDELQAIATSYFNNLFSSSYPSNTETVTSCLKPCIVDQDKALLLQEFTKEEVTKALFQMHPLKAPEQSAFLPNRLISDNFLIAYEVLHYMRARRRRKRGWQAIKLDMSKAFDRVEWSYLEAIMKSLGFAERWISLIMGCVTSVSYDILLNGMAIGRVIPSCGLGQGDPLSPYLFILCAEGLTAMLRDAEKSRLIHGVTRAGWMGCPLSLSTSEIQICTTRNDLLWNGKAVNPPLIIEQSLHFLDEHKRVTILKGGAPPTGSRTGSRWTPPLDDSVKINVDGALSLQQRTSGMGAVARDSFGTVLGQRCRARDKRW
ncbi:hypothetical protein SLEP1_g15064 [Rubroshorea leprosula]|uniref:Reverse transcriptase domain-containing protein n=1 Tax=Rubroshorea leprosula TaxID=152421 RepID=A0AAV5IQJ0_9ROSI|nr:hypothetical protein SLEP1_g15064 [Rubroshorea leprosula]